MTGSSVSFLMLPAEIRSKVYSHLVLPRSEAHLEQNEDQGPLQSLKWFIDNHQDFPVNKQIYRSYFEDRVKCHQAAKSLRLVSRQIHQEVTPSFFQHKTFPLCRVDHARKPRESLRADAVKYVRHLESTVFDAELDDTLESLHVHLPHLETVTFKFWQTDDRWPLPSTWKIPDLHTSFFDAIWTRETIDVYDEVMTYTSHPDHRELLKWFGLYDEDDDDGSDLSLAGLTEVQIFKEQSFTDALKVLDPANFRCIYQVSEASEDEYRVTSLCFERKSVVKAGPEISTD